MDCERFREQLSASLDGELTEQERTEVSAHLVSCAACRQYRESLRRTVKQVRDLPRVHAPAHLAGNVVRELPNARPARRARLVLRRWLLWPAIAAAAALAITLFVEKQDMPSATRADHEPRRYAAEGPSEGGEAPDIAETAKGGAGRRQVEVTASEPGKVAIGPAVREAIAPAPGATAAAIEDRKVGLAAEAAPEPPPLPDAAAAVEPMKKTGYARGTGAAARRMGLAGSGAAGRNGIAPARGTEAGPLRMGAPPPALKAAADRDQAAKAAPAMPTRTVVLFVTDADAAARKVEQAFARSLAAESKTKNGDKAISKRRRSRAVSVRREGGSVYVSGQVPAEKVAGLLAEIGGLDGGPATRKVALAAQPQVEAMGKAAERPAPAPKEREVQARTADAAVSADQAPALEGRADRAALPAVVRVVVVLRPIAREVQTPPAAGGAAGR